jgi:hypothetical protein
LVPDDTNSRQFSTQQGNINICERTIVNYYKIKGPVRLSAKRYSAEYRLVHKAMAGEIMNLRRAFCRFGERVEILRSALHGHSADPRKRKIDYTLFM